MAGWVAGKDSAAAQCVEVAFLPGHRLVRDSKLGDARPVLKITSAEWSAFTAVKAGHLDG